MLNWVHVWTPSWPVHDLNILLVQKGCRVTCCMGRNIVLDIHKVTSKRPRRNMATFDSSGSGCTDAGLWLHPPRTAHSSPMVDCTPYHDWRATISIIRLDAGINQPLPLPPVARSHLQMVRTDIRWDEAVRSDHSKQLTVFLWRWDFHRTSTLPLMWSASLSVASQNFAYASLRHPQHPGYFSLRIAICQQPDNSLQYLLWQILCHDPL